MSDFNENIAEQYGLTVYESDAPDREEIDFSVCDSDLDDNVAWVWGAENDYEVECGHKIEWGDEGERGYCVICGKECDWHYENEVVSEGKDEDGNYYCQTDRVRVPHEWHEGDGGIIRQYIEQTIK